MAGPSQGFLFEDPDEQSDRVSSRRGVENPTTEERVILLLVVCSGRDSTVYKAATSLVHKVPGVSLQVCLASDMMAVKYQLSKCSLDTPTAVLFDIDGRHCGQVQVARELADSHHVWLFGFGASGERRYYSLKAELRIGTFTWADKRPRNYRRSDPPGRVTTHIAVRIRDIVKCLLAPH